MRAGLTAALVLLSALGGCTSDAPVPPPAPATGAGTEPVPTEPVDAGPATAESPDWEVGQWWTFQVDHRLAEAPLEITTVVASVGLDAYEVGWTDASIGLRTLIFHLPPLGRVTRPDLGSWWHGDTVSFARFPLTDGATWQAPFRADMLTYTSKATEGPVLSDTGLRFEITGVDTDGRVRTRAIYAPQVEHYVHMEWFFPESPEPVTVVTLVEAGTGHRGLVEVPSAADQFVGGVRGPDPAAPPAVPSGVPAEAFQVQPALTTLVLAGFLGGAEGLYRVSWLPPEGGSPIVFEQDNAPGSTEMTVTIALAPPVEGSWNVVMAAGGSGDIFAEAIGVAVQEMQVG